MHIPRIQALLLVLWFSSPAFGEIPAIDGQFSEWKEEHLVARDDQGDATGAFDITTVSARTNGSQLYLHYDIGRDINLQNGPDSDGTLRLVVELSDQQQLTIDFRKRTAMLNTQPVAWSRLGFSCMPTHASKQYELQFDMAEFGLETGDEISLDFSGSDELAEAVSIVLTADQSRQSEVSFDRTDKSSFRIANLNTHGQGLSDGNRAESIQRLLGATDADIFCFEEEWEEEMFRRSAPNLIPQDGSAEVNLHWSGGCGIAASLKLEPVPMTLERGAAALVELPTGDLVTVISVHLKCCGYSGNREDKMRIREARQLAVQIRRLRDGDFGEKPRNGGIVIIGDYNLVGSRKPLEILKIAGLTDVLLREPTRGAAYTWRSLREDESFWPGRLDLVMYAQAGLKPANGFVLDTAKLSEQSLAGLGLRAQDSLVSDHLLLVADFVPVH